MIYGLLPVFLVRVLGTNVAAESANSLIKIISGAVSDRTGRRKPLVMFGYILSAVVKTLFPQAETASTVLVARVLDRLSKGIRDAPPACLMWPSSSSLRMSSMIQSSREIIFVTLRLNLDLQIHAQVRFAARMS